MVKNEQGLRIAKLVHVSVENGKTGQSNKYYNMFEQADGTTRCEWGRVGKDCKITILQPGEFDEVYRQKVSPKKDYKDHTELLYEKEALPTQQVATTDKGEIIEIACSYVRTLFNNLMSYAKKSVSANYKVKAADVTEAQVDKAQSIVDDIARELKGKSSVKQINDKFLELYGVIPRTMRDVRDYLVKSLNTQQDLDHALMLISKEQDTLDTMAGQVKLIKQQREANKALENKDDSVKKVDILDQMGLTIKHVTDKAVIEQIKKMMADNAKQFKGAYEVTNVKTQKQFEARLNSSKNKQTTLLWHGSRNENFFSILQSGLMIRPAGAAHSGSMFGDAIYGANKAQKSIGYTSLRGSYWASGSDNTAYLALFDFHTGDQKHIYKHDSSCYSLCESGLKKEGFDSVFAHGGIDLRNDEITVYNSNQVTIKYLVEIGG